jgi:hypothetical protein
MRLGWIVVGVGVLGWIVVAVGVLGLVVVPVGVLWIKNYKSIVCIYVNFVWLI